MSNALSIETTRSDLVKSFYDRCDDLLRLKDLNQQVDFKDHKWVLKFLHKDYSRENAYLDFSSFEKDLKFKEHIEINGNDGEKANIDFVDFIKFIYLEVTKRLTINRKSQSLLEILKLLSYFIKEQNIDAINADNIQDYFNLLLAFDYEGGDIVRRISTPSCSVRFKSFSYINLKRALDLFNVKGIWDVLDADEINGALNESCLDILDMTYSDYSEGGSLDFIGLDVGRYYVDYCAEFFEEFVSYGAAVNKTMSNLTTVEKELAYGLMRGGSQNQSLPFSKEEKGILSVFVRAYNEIAERNKLFSLDSIEKIVVALGLDTLRFDTHEFCRSMLYAKYFTTNIISRDEICKEYQSTLHSDTDLTVSKFDAVCQEQLVDLKISENAALDFCKKNYSKLKAIGLNLKHNSVGQGIQTNIVDAGLVCFMASVGWRVSEYSFPLSALYIEKNNDITDSAYTPLRSYIHWTSSKTSGETLLRREITLSTNILIHQISELVGVDVKSEAPALVVTGNRETFTVRKYLSIRVGMPFFVFVDNYSLFNEVRKVSKGEASLEQLNEIYGVNSDEYQGLLELIEKLSQDIEKLKIAREFKTSLELFKQNNTDGKTERLVDVINNTLSKETIEEIKLTESGFRLEAIKAIKREFLDGVYRPLPHGFRHMWAEAVLRRYRGSVGKFIRANFKHVDDRFFMAYIRNKETKAIYEVAKRATVSSVVKKHLTNKGRAYAGGFNRFLSKTVKATKVVSKEEYEALANKISNHRVIDIKANPWGTCFLRVNSEQSAKCSKDGVPQRHNASPKLCLSCVNVDIEKGNFVGIVVYTKSDVEACRNSGLPFFIKEPCIEVLRSAIKRVSELHAKEPNVQFFKFIQHLEESIKMALKNKDDLND